MRRLVAAIRDNDERKVERAVLQLAGTRKIFAPLALAVGAFVRARRQDGPGPSSPARIG